MKPYRLHTALKFPLVLLLSYTIALLAGPLSFRLYDIEAGLNRDEYMVTKLALGVLLLFNVLRQHQMKKAADAYHQK